MEPYDDRYAQVTEALTVWFDHMSHDGTKRWSDQLSRYLGRPLGPGETRHVDELQAVWLKQQGMDFERMLRATRRDQAGQLYAKGGNAIVILMLLGSSSLLFAGFIVVGLCLFVVGILWFIYRRFR